MRRKLLMRNLTILALLFASNNYRYSHYTLRQFLLTYLMPFHEFPGRLVQNDLGTVPEIYLT